MSPILAVSGLTRRIGGVVAVDRVDLSVPRGGCLALIGPNGAGKSTLFNLVNGQLAPDAGEVLFEGAPVTGLAPRAIFRRGIGRTFQIAAPFRSMTAAENVSVALAARDRRTFALAGNLAARRRAEAVDRLARVGLADLADRPASALAYGDLKRLELAVALAGNPRLLLMDEPTAGMSAGERLALAGLVRDLVDADGLSVLFTEHSMDVVFGLADRIVVLSRGRVIAEGAPEAVRADPEVQAVYLGTGLEGLRDRLARREPAG